MIYNRFSTSGGCKTQFFPSMMSKSCQRLKTLQVTYDYLILGNISVFPISEVEKLPAKQKNLCNFSSRRFFDFIEGGKLTSCCPDHVKCLYLQSPAVSQRLLGGKVSLISPRPKKSYVTLAVGSLSISLMIWYIPQKQKHGYSFSRRQLFEMFGWKTNCTFFLTKMQ